MPERVIPEDLIPENLIRVTQVRSYIGTKPKHRGTLRALGLRGIGQFNVLPDRPEIRGMIARVTHLVEVSSIKDSDSKDSDSKDSDSKDSDSKDSK